MKFRIFYDLKPKFTAKDADSFSRGDYKCRILMQTRRGAPVVISQHQDTGIWRVTHSFSNMVFGTKAEALALADGKVVTELSDAEWDEYYIKAKNSLR